MRGHRVATVLLGAWLLLGCGDGPPPVGAEPGPASPRAGSTPPDVLLITIDTLRWDALGCYGRTVARTPRLDALAAEGARFRFAFAPTGSTLSSLSTVLTGVSPLTHGVIANGYTLLAASPTIAEAFGRSGYRTGAFLANQCAPLVDRSDQASRGFDRRFCGVDHEAPQHVWDLAVTDAAVSFLEQERDRPVFCWVHLMDPHGPHVPPAPLVIGEWIDALRPAAQSRTLRDLQFSGETPPRRVLDGLWRLYDAEVAGSDAHVGRLVETVRARRGAEAVVVVAGDHGEDLFEHDNYYGHSSSIYDVVLRVPMIVVAPGRVPAGRVPNGFAQLQDLFPTLLELADVRGPSGLEGRSLLPAIHGETADVSRAAIGSWHQRVLTLRTPRYRFVWNRAASSGHLPDDAFLRGFRHFTESELLFDHRVDPREVHSLLPREAAVAEAEVGGETGEPPTAGAETGDEAGRRLRSALRRWLGERPPLPAEPHPIESEDVQEELRELGYVGGG